MEYRLIRSPHERVLPQSHEPATGLSADKRVRLQAQVLSQPPKRLREHPTSLQRQPPAQSTPQHLTNRYQLTIRQ